MPRRARVQPSRTASIFVVIVGLGMLVFGCVFLSSSSGSGIGGLFGIIWVLVICGIIVSHLINATTGQDPMHTVIEYDSDNKQASAETTADKLRELQHLRNEGLITEEEFAEKRRKILQQL